MHLYFYFTYNSSVLVGSTFGGTWEDPEGGIIKFAVKRALKQDQTLHMEGKLQFIRYFSRECCISLKYWVGSCLPCLPGSATPANIYRYRYSQSYYVGRRYIHSGYSKTLCAEVDNKLKFPLHMEYLVLF